MKLTALVTLLWVLTACVPAENRNAISETLSSQELDNTSCTGSTDVPDEFKNKLKPAQDETLLASSLGAPGKGKLCQGKVYEVKNNATITLFRAWNSTNPNSQLGNWWAFYQPSSKVADYRRDYEICYQWSPLDKLTRCEVKAGTRLVIGTGQSAVCSQYLTYPVSEAQQVFIAEASNDVLNCQEYDLLFSWQ